MSQPPGGSVQHFEHGSMYWFNHTPAFSVNDGNTAAIGAFHGSEVPFVWFDDFELLGQGEQALSQRQ